MNISKEIINICPNYYTIVNFDIEEDDVIFEKLIHIYKEYIFNIDLNDEEAKQTVIKIDSVLGKYINDYMFRKEMHKEIKNIRISSSCPNILKAIVDSIIAIFNHYEEYTTRNIYISRWI